MKVRAIKASNNGRFFLAAEFEKKVAAFDIQSGEKLGEYDTRYEWGGSRLCISDSGRYFAAAAYGRWGITLYDTASGETLWNTKEVKKVQHLDLSADDTVLYVTNGLNTLYTLSLEDGSIISTEKGVEKIFPSSDLEVKMTGKGLLKWEGSSVKPEGSVLSFCSGGGQVYSSIMGGGLKCFSADGKEVWSAENKPNEHYVSLGYSTESGHVLGMGYKFDSPRKKPYWFLDVYNAQDGTPVYSYGLDDGQEFAFAGGRKVICSGGSVINIGNDSCFAEGQQIHI